MMPNSLSDLNVRLCQLDDIAQILQIRRNTFLHFAPSSYSPQEVQNLLDDIQESELREMVANKSFFVAEIDNQIVGCGGWLDESVRHMYVSPKMTQKGIGSKLLETLENDYQEQTNNSSIKAGVIVYARVFYEKNGYEIIQEDIDWDGSRFYRMRKNL
jgi:ribosomal protein S18 acetylase RimI-like enzyme